jgi:predicted nucleotidyltransferase
MSVTATRTRTQFPAAEVLDEIVRRVVAVAKPQRIVLFGSAARGEMGPNSDLDLLIVKPGVQRKRLLAGEILQALQGVPAPVDVIIATPEEIERYGDTPALIFREALREGKTLYVA